MTYSEAEQACGLCTACGEWTNIIESCCGAAVFFEGSTYCEEDFEEDEGK